MERWVSRHILHSPIWGVLMTLNLFVYFIVMFTKWNLF